MIKTIVELHLPKGLGVNRGGHNPFASRVWVVLALCVPRVVRSIVLESSKSHLPQGDALSQRHLGTDSISFSLWIYVY